MAKVLDLSKSVHDLAEQYPEFKDIMVSLGFTDIVKPAALNTVGRVMTVPRGCGIKDINLEDAVKAFQNAGFTVTGIESTSSSAEGDANPFEEAPASTGDAQADSPSTKTDSPHGAGLDEAGRAKLLESYVARLSAGEPLESVRSEFVANFENVDAAEIARAEQNLIEGGANINDVQRLCDVHSALFHGATREEKIANAENAVMDSLAQGSGANDFKTKVLAAIPGHPVHVFASENDAISKQIARARAALDTSEATAELGKLCQLGIHYAKKGDLIYPVLKLQHDFSGPSDVMWGVDDEIRAELRAVATATTHDDAWHQRAEAVLTRADEMVYKEANILLPLCAQNFTDDEWLQMYVDMKGYDLCLIEDAGIWQTGEKYYRDWLAKTQASAGVRSAGPNGEPSSAPGAEPADLGNASPAAESAAPTSANSNGDQLSEVVLPSGTFTVAQLDALLNTLPLEITFIDDHEINRYWNDNGEKKLFKRPAAALGREVWSCHPPKVQPMVRGVINSLKSGEQNSVDIWMQKEGEPVLVRYMAVRDREGNYLGTMECIQRMGFAQKHFSADQTL